MGGVEEGDTDDGGRVEAEIGAAPMPSEPASPQAISERKSPYSFSTRTIWNFSGAMITLPSRASNNSTECGTSWNCSATSRVTRSNRPSVAFWMVYFDELVTFLPVLRAG